MNTVDAHNYFPMMKWNKPWHKLPNAKDYSPIVAFNLWF